MARHADTPPARSSDAAAPIPVIPVEPVPAPVHAPVLTYEKPFLYRYKSDLPPPGVVAKGFWRACFAAGRLFARFYRPRPEPRP